MGNASRLVSPAFNDSATRPEPAADYFPRGVALLANTGLVNHLSRRMSSGGVAEGAGGPGIVAPGMLSAAICRVNRALSIWSRRERSEGHTFTVARWACETAPAMVQSWLDAVPDDGGAASNVRLRCSTANPSSSRSRHLEPAGGR